MRDGLRYEARNIRDYLKRRGRLKGSLVRYVYRPLDVRWLYWEPDTKLLDEKRSEYLSHVFEGNLSIAAAPHHRREFDPPSLVRHLGSLHLYERGANLFPLFLKVESRELLSKSEADIHPNLTETAGCYLRALGIEPIILFHHVIGLLFAGKYGLQNGFALRQDWPRIPLPGRKKALLSSAGLGRRVAGLLDTESPVEGVTSGKIDPRLTSLGVIRKIGGGALEPGAGELDVTAGWGGSGAGGVCMPRRGRAVERSQPDEATRKSLGKKTFDVYLNETAYWENVPERVWKYTIGGYQVIKKWLSYREKAVLGRGLKIEEAEYVTEMVRRIAALILLEPELDANYEQVKADVWDWPTEEG